MSPRRQRSPARTVVLYRIQKVYGRERGLEGDEGRGRDKRQKVWVVDFCVAVTAFVTTTKLSYI